MPETSLTIYASEQARRENDVRSELQLFAESTKSQIFFRGDRIDTIIIGERHGQDANLVQADLARRVNPDVVLLEELSNLYFDPKSKDFKIQDPSLTLGIERTIAPNEFFDINEMFAGDNGSLPTFRRLSFDKRIPLVGVDLSGHEVSEILFPGFGHSQVIRDRVAIFAQQYPDIYKRLPLDEKVLSVRDKRILQFIQHYQKLGQRAFMVVGKHHGDFLFNKTELNNLCYIDTFSFEGVNLSDLNL